MKHAVLRTTIFALVAFGALTTVTGGIGLLTGAIPVSSDWLQSSPFVDYTVPALSLLVIVGGSMLLAAATILTGREMGVLTSAFSGLAMMIFELVEAAVIDHIGGSELMIAVVLQSFFFVLGLVIFMLATSLWMTEYRRSHLKARQASHM